MCGVVGFLFMVLGTVGFGLGILILSGWRIAAFSINMGCSIGRSVVCVRCHGVGDSMVCLCGKGLFSCGSFPGLW